MIDEETEDLLYSRFVLTLQDKKGIVRQPIEFITDRAQRNTHPLLPTHLRHVLRQPERQLDFMTENKILPSVSSSVSREVFDRGFDVGDHRASHRIHVYSSTLDWAPCFSHQSTH